MINCAFSASLKGDPPSWIAYSMPVNSSNLSSMRTKEVGTPVTSLCVITLCRDASKVGLRSVLILFSVLHVETMFGNEGEGFLHACISIGSPEMCFVFN